MPASSAGRDRAARPSRRVVGIDLGTTHTVVAWADPRAAAPAAEIFPVPQLVTPTEIEARPLFPSFLYAPVAAERPADPWGDAPFVLGELARRRGAEVPGRLVASSKSWLCHPGVDRSAPILPWGAPEDAADLPRLSPLAAATRLLAHVRRAWDEAWPEAPLAAQEVILTVPASFDEVARELTLEAARAAGLAVRLLEEPQAAFYDYMRIAGAGGLAELVDGAGGEALVLVVDVGGGTTDLSLIRVARGAGERPFEVERIAVGHHLLLGGDNMDLALAHLCERRMVPEGERLDPARFGQLVLACRAAKERLLGGREGETPDEAPVTVLAAGSRLLGGTLTTRLGREEAERVVLDGFFPGAARDARPQRARGGLMAFGLPYEKDVAITRHVAWFFARHAPGAAGPHALLLNGGVFRARRVAERIGEAIQAWGGPALAALPHVDPDLAVARGAVAYGLALAGQGLRIEGGAARGYYVGLEAPRGGGPRPLVCVVPRGAREGAPQVAAGRTFALVVGRPVRFDLFASDDARVDRPGDVVPLDEDAFEALPPLAVSLDPREARGDGPGAGDARERKGRSPGPAGTEVKVQLEGELTAIGTLDLACVEVNAEDPRRFRLAFQLREAPAAAGAGEGGAGGASEKRSAPPPRVGGKRLEEAREAIERVFGKGRPDVEARDVKNLVRELERVLGERGGWTAETSRALFDTLIPGARSRRRSADHERVFWQLAGFCLRPGFGDPGDPARVAALAPLLPEKLAFPQEVRGEQQFWIAWRRVAGGLAEATQAALRDLCDPFLAPAEKKLKKPKGFRPEALDDLLDLAASLERVPPQRRSELGAWILERTWTSRDPRLWAAIGRIGARVPAYASVHHVVSPQAAERWLDHLLREKWETLPTAAPAAVQMARLTGDRARDVSDRARAEVERRLVKVGAEEAWIRAVREVTAVEEADRAAFFGEGLPAGLRLVEE